MFRLVINHLLSFLKEKCGMLIYFNQWILLFSIKKGLSTSLWRFKKIIPPKDRFFADPFIIQKENKVTIITKKKSDSWRLSSVSQKIDQRFINLENFDQALQIINNHEFGDGTSIYTSNGGFARNFMKNVQIGMVGINVPIPVPMAFYSFGGWKDSLFGSNNTYGMEGVRFYTKVKTVSSSWPSGIKDGALFSMPVMK